MEFYEKAFMRNIGVFSKAEQEKIKNLTVAIAGCGGMGSQAAEQFARLGVEDFSVADFDNYDTVNINNQFNCVKETIGRNKAEVTSERILSINPNANVRVFKEGVKCDNVEDFIDNADFVVDAIDYTNQKDSLVLHEAARSKQLYVFAPQAIGFGASVLVFDPEGMSILDYVGGGAIQSSQIDAEKFSPYIPSYADPKVIASIENGTAEYIPNIASAQVLGIAMIAAESLGMILKGKKPICVPKGYHIDLWDKKIVS